MDSSSAINHATTPYTFLSQRKALCSIVITLLVLSIIGALGLLNVDHLSHMPKGLQITFAASSIVVLIAIVCGIIKYRNLRKKEEADKNRAKDEADQQKALLAQQSAAREAQEKAFLDMQNQALLNGNPASGTTQYVKPTYYNEQGEPVSFHVTTMPSDHPPQSAPPSNNVPPVTILPPPPAPAVQSPLSLAPFQGIPSEVIEPISLYNKLLAKCPMEAQGPLTNSRYTIKLTVVYTKDMNQILKGRYIDPLKVAIIDSQSLKTADGSIQQFYVTAVKWAKPKKAHLTVDSIYHKNSGMFLHPSSQAHLNEIMKQGVGGGKGDSFYIFVS